MSQNDDIVSPESRRRLEELLVDDALGTLEADAATELRQAGVEGNPFHTVVAALGEAIVPASAMPLTLQRKIEASAGRYVRNGTPAGAQISDIPLTYRIGAWAGWGLAAAACVALGFALTRQPPPPQVVVREVIKEVPAPQPALPTPAEARTALLAQDANILKANWTKGNTNDVVQGDVVWSADRQSGFMRLAGLPALAAGFQYQLWIIDAAREGQNPVDGGVFDVSASGEVIVPFSAKLKVTEPAAFAITVERAGGVPVSKQEKVAALAKPA